MITTESGALQVNVITQNVLLDYTRTREHLILPQHERIGSIATTLAGFDGELDVVGIQEAQKSKRQHNGETLASELGMGPGFWVNHNQKPYPGSLRGRSGEYVGLFGSQVESASPIELGDNRIAPMTVIADVAFVTLHLRAGGLESRQARLLQAVSLAEELEPYPNAVLFGDFNEPPIRYVAKARDYLKTAQFESVFNRTHQPHPKTSPTLAYRDLLSDGNGWKTPFIRHGWSIDDILVRGPRVKALAAGILQREIDTGSDHEGVWAALELAPTHD